MFQVIQLQQLSCPGLNTQWVQVNLGSGTLVSVGFQNNGNAQNFWASQMYPINASQAYWQVNNTSLTSTQWWPWVVVYQEGDAAALTADNAKIETGTAPLAEGTQGPAGGNS